MAKTFLESNYCWQIWKLKSKWNFQLQLPHTAAARQLPTIASTHLFCWEGCRDWGPPSIPSIFRDINSDIFISTAGAVELTSCLPVTRSQQIGVRLAGAEKGRNRALLYVLYSLIYVYSFPTLLFSIPFQPDLTRESLADSNSPRSRIYMGRESGERGGRKSLVNIFPFSYLPPTYCKNQSPLSFCSACVNV